MKAIFVESLNGYLAKGPNDDMSWTPTLDKKIFKLLSFALGGIYFCSKRTFNLLPEVMTTDPNRHFEIVDHNYSNDDWYLASKLFSNAVVLGGPTFLKAVYDKGLIDTFIVTTTLETIQGTPGYENPFTEILKTWTCVCETTLKNMIIKVYKNE